MFDEIASPYGVSFRIAAKAFDLQKNWDVPSSSDELTAMGAWITPNRYGLTMLGSLIIGAVNALGFDVAYHDTLKMLVNLSNQSLYEDTGVLYRISYYSGMGTIDLNSIQFRVMQVASSPEQSLALGDRDQLSADYKPSSVFPERLRHYVWMYKSVSSDLVIVPIKDPYVEYFEQQAFLHKSKLLLYASSQPSWSDHNLKLFEGSQILFEHAARYQTQLKEAHRDEEIERLNRRFYEAQEEFNRLHLDYLRHQNELRSQLATSEFFNVCERLNGFFENGSADKTIGDEALKIRIDVLQSALGNAETNRQSLVDRLKAINLEINTWYQQRNLPPPEVLRIP